MNSIRKIIWVPSHTLKILGGAILASAFIAHCEAASVSIFKANDPSRMEVPDASGRKVSSGDLSGPDGELIDVEKTPRMLDVQEAKPLLSSGTSRPFRVNHIKLTGVTVYSAEQLRPLYAALEGRDVTLQQINSAAAQITHRYRQDGYLLVKTVIPVQRINNGLLELHVTEGRINNTNIQGDTNRATERYAENIRNDVPLTATELERNILLMNDLPGNEARATLSPSSEKAGSDLLINNKLKRWDGFLGLDNRDSRHYGSWQGYGGLNLNNPLDIGDRLSFRYGHSFESNYMAFYEGQYEAPINRYGTTMSILYQHNDGYPDTYSFLNANSHGDNIIARLNHPWMRSRMENINSSVAFTWYNGTSEYFNDPDNAPSSDDRIRALRVGTSWDFVDSHGGSNLVKAELSQGLHVMGASHEGRNNPSREGGNTNFTKLQLDLQRLQNLDPITQGLAIYMAMSAQTAFGEALLTPEQFGVGGSQFGRGYDASEISGDNGIAGKLELQYSKLHVINEYPIPVQYYSFWDVGKVWNNEPRYTDSESLASLGGGVRINPYKDLHITGEVAFPLTRSVASEEAYGYNGNKARFFLNVLKMF